MDKFGKDVVITFFVLLIASFILGAYNTIYAGTTEVWKSLPIYQVIYAVSNVLLLVLDLPIFLYITVVPPFVSAKLPTLAAIIAIFFVLLNITYLYFISFLITSFVFKKRLA